MSKPAKSKKKHAPKKNKIVEQAPQDPIEFYWSKRLEAMKSVLETNNFDVFIAEDAPAAGAIVLRDILPDMAPTSLSWGGSMTFKDTGLYETLTSGAGPLKGAKILDTYDPSLSPEDKTEMRRQALLVDCYFTGCNAITEEGHLINLDMIGNRVAALTFGPKNVIVFVGRNKIVENLEEGMYRIKNYAAPANAIRLGMKTPCTKSSVCEDCQSPNRICNNWTITEKSFPKARTKVVLINEDLGL